MSRLFNCYLTDWNVAYTGIPYTGHSDRLMLEKVILDIHIGYCRAMLGFASAASFIKRFDRLLFAIKSRNVCHSDAAIKIFGSG